MESRAHAQARNPNRIPKPESDRVPVPFPELLWLMLWSHCPNQLWETHRNNLEIVCVPVCVCVAVCGWVALPPRDVCCCQLKRSDGVGGGDDSRNWNWNLLHVAHCTLHKQSQQLQRIAARCTLHCGLCCPFGCATFVVVAFLTLAAAAFLATCPAVSVSVPVPVVVSISPSPHASAPIGSCLPLQVHSGSGGAVRQAPPTGDSPDCVPC